ncbi:glucuronate isomerase [bacterium]|nr:glucuronate isomerase [bacterium]
MKEFMDDNFLLSTKPAEILYHEHAKEMPIFDYHCHLPIQDIAENRKFPNITQIWLYGDHYKWRAMRANGIDENLITGSASDRDKFYAWAKTVPMTIGNPLYHWTHLELRRYFGITDLLSPATAESIYNKTAEMLAKDEFSVLNLLRKFKVRAACTTDDPVDSLEFHKKTAGIPGSPCKILPTFRPDKAMNFGNPEDLNAYLDTLSACTGIEITSFTTYINAIKARHDFFHEAGCRLADHALLIPVCREASANVIDAVDSAIDATFTAVRNGTRLSSDEVEILHTAALREVGRMHADKGWVMQLHIGALRNSNTRMKKLLGPDTGYDSVADNQIAAPLARFLDSLDRDGMLPKTILYSLNPCDNYTLGTMTGNFQDGTTPGKIQFGSAWWFNDQKEGMEQQLSALANLGLLSRFVGMLTDSRSFLSYPRHEYFRRILCSYLGGLMENGEAPEDYKLMGNMVRDICYNNAVNYFGISIPQNT